MLDWNWIKIAIYNPVKLHTLVYLNYGPSIIRFKNFTKTVWRAELIWDFTRENSAVVNAFIKNKSVKGPSYTRSWTSTAKLHYHLHLTKRRDDETSNFSTRRADDWCQQQPRPPRFKTFSWPEDNSGSELCRIRFLSCCCLDLPHHHPSHRRTTSPEQWYPAKFSGKCSLTYGCSHVGNIGSVNMRKGSFFPEA